MKLISCKVNNYKSIGEEKNEIYFNDLTIILGKNESGKSNIVEAISGVDVIGYTNKKYFSNKNKKNNKDISVELIFKTTENDIKVSEYQENIIVNIESEEVCKIDKNFGEYILNKKEIKEQYYKLMNFLEKGSLPFSQQESIKKYNAILEKLNKINEEIFVLPVGIDVFLKKLKQTGNEKFVEFCELLKELENRLENIYCDFPKFIFLTSGSLKTTYSIAEYDKEIEEEETSILYQFLELVKINPSELKNIMESKDNSYIMNKQIEYNGLIRENFAKKFNAFYSQEIIEMQVMISFNCLNFLIKTNGAYLDYSERSNGLKWYTNIFIQLLFNSKSKFSNNIILLDEPGVFLHPLAQKELASLFNDLSTKGNQIIYTTHSPFMINYNEFHNIRAVEKDDNGFSLIYNKITEFPRKSKNKTETITPLINAIGYNMSLAIGPNCSNKNIIVEGITDYFYLNSYIMQKDMKNYNIIASVGADNIPAISSILYGWGCDFIVLLDQDTKGRSVYDKIKDTNQPYFDKLVFADAKPYDKNQKFEIEDIFDEDDQKNLGITSKDYKSNKYYYAMRCYELIKNNEYIFNDNTMNQFEELFKAIEK